MNDDGWDLAKPQSWTMNDDTKLYKIWRKFRLLAVRHPSQHVSAHIQLGVKTHWWETTSGSGHQSSPSLSLLGTSIILGLSITLASRWPLSTIPMIQLWFPSNLSMSLQKAAACSLGMTIRRPPDTSGQRPCARPHGWPFSFSRAVDSRSIWANTGRLWMTKLTYKNSFSHTAFLKFILYLTSDACALTSPAAWPRRPNFETSVAPCAPYLCINIAADLLKGMWMKLSFLVSIRSMIRQPTYWAWTCCRWPWSRPSSPHLP